MIKKSKNRTVDYQLLIIIGVIIVFGLIMLSSASTVSSFQRFDDPNYLLKRQFVSFLVGLVAFFFTIRIDYHFWQKVSLLLLGVSMILLLLVFIPGIGTELLGAQRWIDLGGGLVFQPTEIVKLTFIIYLASWLEKRGRGIDDVTSGLLPFLTILGVIGILIMMQPDMGTMTIIALTALIIYFVAGAPFKHLTWIVGGGIAAFFLLIKIAPYRAERFTIFLNPELDPQGSGYHINQALLAIGSGGLFGVGLGHSRQKFNYLPESAGDSIFAIIAEELGFIVAAGLLFLFVLLLIRGFNVARNAKDEYGKLLAVGITSWFVIQAFVNIGALTGILPLTGIPLPFISYGGSALIISMVAAAILLNISRYAKK
jgi:cell division protein FtsW